jgi:hypothetical protein
MEVRKMIKIEISTSNQAFELDAQVEVARILRELADKIEQGEEPTRLRDLNGNSVGSVTYPE